MSRSVDGAIRFSGEAIEYIKQFVEDGEDIYEEGATYFNFDKFFSIPEELLDSGDDKVRTAIIHGVAALNPESSFTWGENFSKFEDVESFNNWFDHLFDSSLRRTKKELEEKGYVDMNLLTVPDKMLSYGKTISIERTECVDEEELMAIFNKCQTLVEKYDCIFRRDYRRCSWTGRFQCSFWEKNGIGYLSFDLYNHFPTEVAVKLSLDFPELEVGVDYHVEDWGGSLYVFKNGKCVFKDSYEDSYYDSEDEELEEVVVKENPTSISFENFYQNEERPPLTPEEIEEQNRQWQEQQKLWDDEKWFNDHKDTLLKDSDGTYIITDDMPEGAKNKALECNKIIIAKAQEPTYEEVVKELGREYISFDEMIKAITWLEHHEHLCEGWDTIVSKDMPILVKAHILFRRKRDEEQEKFWSTMRDSNEEVIEIGGENDD